MYHSGAAVELRTFAEAQEQCRQAATKDLDATSAACAEILHAVVTDLDQAWEHAALPEAVPPTPATHAILTVLKAGESVIQILLLTKTVVHVYRGARPLFHAVFWRQNTV